MGEHVQARNPAVKIENQLSLNLSAEVLPTDGTPEDS
jgi:hypothetical protein